MTKQITYRIFATLAVATLLWGCAESAFEGSLDGDKPDESLQDGGKEDRWDWRSNPNRFNGEFVTELAQLPREGRSAVEAWPSSYFPTYRDAINHRWQGNDELSAAEKYDRAFNGWTPSEDFMSLRPFNPSRCEDEWDAAYYEQLGPLASYISRYMGNQRARNGQDDDDDGVADNCGSDGVNDGLETWWGLCHAWVPAAMLEDRPLRAVTYNGVTFDTGDMEALLIAAYNRTPADMIGGRCNEGGGEDSVVERDEQGRATNNACRDTNAGSFHIIMTNRLGIQQRPFAIDRTYDYEVWNQPAVGFNVSRVEEITVERANELLGLTGETYTYNEDAAQLFDVSADLQWITESHASTTPNDASRYERTDYFTYILEVDRNGDIIGGEWHGNSRELHPDFLWDPRRLTRSSVSNLDLDNARMLIAMSREAAQPTGGDALVVSGRGDIRIPDNNATGVTSLATVTEDVAVQSLVVELNITHTYIGDLRVALSHDGVKTIIHNQTGGSRDNLQTTFPVAAFDGMSARGEWTLMVSDNANLDVGTLNGWTLTIGSGSGGGATTDGNGTWTNSTRVDIPDNSRSGVTSTIETDVDGTVGRVKVDLDVSHTYTGDLVVTLSHGGVERTLHDRAGGAADDIDASFDVDGFAGVDAKGTWTLRLTDLAGADVGRLNSWTLRLLTGADGGGSATPESFPGEGGIAIPDNDATGIRSTAVVPAAISSGRVAISVNIEHTYRGDLKLVVSHGSQTFPLHDREGGRADNLVQSFPLRDFSGSPAGEWVLQVSDHAGRDVGTLNSWSVVVSQ